MRVSLFVGFLKKLETFWTDYEEIVNNNMGMKGLNFDSEPDHRLV